MRWDVTLKSLLVLSLSFTITAKANPTGLSTPKNQMNRTDLRMLTPFTPNGLNPKLNIVKHCKGTCWTTSQVNSARPNTWRCQAENIVYDPCFKNPVREQNSVVCMQNPWDKSVMIIELDSPLPVTHNYMLNTQNASPWALELSNGKLCILSIGPNVKVAGMAANYSCGSGAIVIGSINRNHQKWSAFYLGNESLYMSEMPILSAWY